MLLAMRARYVVSMDTLCQLVYEASKAAGGYDLLARRVGVASWEVVQWIAGLNLPRDRERAVLQQALILITGRLPGACWMALQDDS